MIQDLRVSIRGNASLTMPRIGAGQESEDCQERFGRPFSRWDRSVSNNVHYNGPSLDRSGIVFDDRPANPSIVQGLDEEISSKLGKDLEYLADVHKA
jgi:hypothetical protein